MEITEDYVTMLTPDGEFLRSRHEERQYELGEEILFFPLIEGQPDVSETKIKRRSWRRAVLSSVAAAALLLFFLPYYLQQQVYAYMSIDINPSLELGVNRQFEVVEIQTFNKDAKKLVASIKEWKHRPVEEVTSKILAASEHQGYLKREKEVLITTVFKKEKKDYKEQLQTDIQSVTEEWKKKPYTIETVKSSLEVREKAVELGVSTGTWLRKEEIKQKPASKSKPVKPNSVHKSGSKEPVNPQPSQKGKNNLSPSPAKQEEQPTEKANSTLKPIKQQIESKLNNKQELPKGGEKELKPSPQPAEKAKEKQKQKDADDKQKKSTSASYQRPEIEKEKQKGNDGWEGRNSFKKENEKRKNANREKEKHPSHQKTPGVEKEKQMRNETEKKPAFSAPSSFRQRHEERENNEKKNGPKPSHLNSSSKREEGRVEPVFREKEQKPEQSHSKPAKIENQRERWNGKEDHKKDRPHKHDQIL